MRILVDSQQIDVTLENERTLADVVAAVNDWVVANGSAVTTLTVDGEQHALDQPPDRGQRALDSIAEIRVETQPQWQLILEHLELVLQFLRTWDTALQHNDHHSIQSLVAQQEDLARHLQEHIELIFPELPESTLQSVFEVTGSAEQMISPPDGVAALRERLGALIALIEQRVSEVRYPAREAALTAGLISGMLNEVREVSVLLQTGKDQEAMANVVRFSELVEKLLRILPHLARRDQRFHNRLAQSGDLGTITAALNNTLLELVQAFDTQDSVLIGDLLEYEIAPRVEELISVIPSAEGPQSQE